MTHYSIERNPVYENGWVDLKRDGMIIRSVASADEALNLYNEMTRYEDAQFPAVAGGNGASYRHCDT